MKTAFLSDVHGNWLALQAVMAEIAAQGCERVYCLGDVFGYLPDGEKCLESLGRLGAELLLGNHEAMLLGVLSVDPARGAVYRLPGREALPAAVRRTLGGCRPWRECVSPAGKRLLLVHGSPWDPLQGYVYPDQEPVGWEELDYDYVFMGHTHHAFVNRQRRPCQVGVGSCGLPRDIGDQACFAVYDDRIDRVDLVRVPLDVATIRATYADVHPSVLACFARRRGNTEQKGKSGHG